MLDPQPLPLPAGDPRQGQPHPGEHAVGRGAPPLAAQDQEHDGEPGRDGGLAAWLRLGEAAGLARTTLLDASGVLPGVRFAVDAYISFCRFRPWREAVAASLTELFAPDLMSRRIEAFELHYPWIAPEGVDYFRSRVTQGRRDATEGLALLAASPPSPQATERLVAAVEFKCDVLWSMLDAIAAASGEAGSPGPEAPPRRRMDWTRIGDLGGD